MPRVPLEGKPVELSNGQTVVLSRDSKYLFIEGIDVSRLRLPRTREALTAVAEVIQIALQQIENMESVPKAPKRVRGRPKVKEPVPRPSRATQAQIEASEEAYRLHVKACRSHGAEIMDREAFAIDHAGVTAKGEEEEREEPGRHEPYMKYPQYVSPINWEAI